MRVLPSLLDPSPSGVCPFFSRLFLCWRPCWSRSHIPSLAPSWWWPCPLLRWALLTLSGSVLGVPSAVSLRRSHGLLPSHCRPSCAVSFRTVSVFGARFALRRGVSPGVGPVGALGELRWLHLYRLRLDLVGLLLFAGCLGAPVGVLCLLCDIPPVFMAIFWSVSLTPACPLRVPPMRGCSLDSCVACTWLDLMSSSTLFQDSVICADFWS